MQTFYFNELDSTNLEARRRWLTTGQSLSACAFAVIAAQQSAGMGRAGRTWKSPVGGLWLSVAWPLKQNADIYAPAPLVVGLAVADALRACCHLSCAIKWPNDLLVQGKKLAGVLCQCDWGITSPVLIAGVGINGNFPAVILGDDLRQPATSLYDEIGQSVDLQALQILLIENICQNLEYLQAGRFGSHLLSRIRQCLAWRNQQVILGYDSQDHSLEGQLLDVNESGHAVVMTRTGRQTVSSGELRLSTEKIVNESH
ncbi:MAG: biotin--[acetyl-CoA-carboxylase] ligase [Planctomycetes bacterium]|jgi:BirA family biotin operon repressor/biotin-[acetyl-CoA-carboxylase] ligase|nr:biotin--[acetyl-CoA-carboxylase] ligase [Planctomycetota bacterium]